MFKTNRNKQVGFWGKNQFGYLEEAKIYNFLEQYCQKELFRADNAKVMSSVSHPSHTIYLVKIASSSFKIVA